MVQTGSFNGKSIIRKRNNALAFQIVSIFFIIYLIPLRAVGQAAENDLNIAFSTFNDAFEKADVDVLSKMLTENYVHTNQGSAPISSESWLNYIKSRRSQLNNGLLVISSYLVDEVVMQNYGRSAVITGVVHSIGKYDGKPKNSDIRFTQLWINENGQWKRAAFQDCKIR